jgi:hypothetical protein
MRSQPITRRRFNLYDLGFEVGQQHRRHRPGHTLAEIDDPHTLKG